MTKEPWIQLCNTVQKGNICLLSNVTQASWTGYILVVLSVVLCNVGLHRSKRHFFLNKIFEATFVCLLSWKDKVLYSISSSHCTRMGKWEKVHAVSTKASPMPMLAGHDHVRQKWSEELFCLLSCLAGSASGRLPRPRPVFRSDAASGRP